MNDLLGFIFWDPPYWFVYAYILLFILSPFIEAGIHVLTARQYKVILLAYFFMEFMYGWLVPSSGLGFEGGHTTISFIGLYLLGRYIRLYPVNKLSKVWGTYVIILLINVLLSLVAIIYNQPKIVWRLYSYCAPFTILQGVCLLCVFSNFSIRNRLVNFLASSAFSVYLLHASPFITESLWFSHISYFYDNYGVCYILFVLCYSIIWYLVALLLDNCRSRVWVGLVKSCNSIEIIK